jgi:hypothetical protein
LQLPEKQCPFGFDIAQYDNKALRK